MVNQELQNQIQIAMNKLLEVADKDEAERWLNAPLKEWSGKSPKDEAPSRRRLELLENRRRTQCFECSHQNPKG